MHQALLASPALEASPGVVSTLVACSALQVWQENPGDVVGFHHPSSSKQCGNGGEGDVELREGAQPDASSGFLAWGLPGPRGLSPL